MWIHVSFPQLICCVQSIDGTYKSYAISVPSATELLDQIPGADPVLLYEVGVWTIAGTRMLIHMVTPDYPCFLPVMACMSLVKEYVEEHPVTC